MQGRKELKLKELDESEESEELELEELKLELVPGDLGFDDLELELEALGGLEGLGGLELKKIIAQPHKRGKWWPLWGQTPRKWQTVATFRPHPTRHRQIPTPAHGETHNPAAP